MNDPDKFPINPQDEIDWLLKYQREHQLSWSALANVSGIPQGTLSTLLKGKYEGNIAAQAKRIFQFRQKVESQSVRSYAALAPAPWIETPSARRILFLLENAHMGRIIVVATGPGTSKTMTARHYASSVQPTYLATMRQTTRTPAAMIDQVMRALRLPSNSGWTRQRAGQIIEFLRDKGALLIIDEANHLEWSSLEELRGWHDEAGVGIALLGNEELMVRIRGGAGSHQYARLNSRIANYHTQDLPSDGDAAAFLDHYDIDDGASRELLRKVAIHPGGGGLREVKQILEAANMLAVADETIVEFRHIEEAMQRRATTQMRRRAA